MTELNIQLLSKTTPSTARSGVVFLHGVDGGPRSTWVNGQNFWPSWVAEDHPNTCVWTVGYPAATSHWRGPTMQLVPRALSLLHFLAMECRSLAGGIVLICHSLGGLVAKQMLRTALDERRPEHIEFAGKIRGIFFIATPHQGSGLADVARLLKWLYQTTPLAEDLHRNCELLLDLNQWFIDNHARLGLAIESCHETQGIVVRGLPPVVHPATQVPIPNRRSIPIDADHISICKLGSRQTLVYGTACDLIRQVSEPVPARKLVVKVKVDVDPVLLSGDEKCAIFDDLFRLAGIAPQKTLELTPGCLEGTFVLSQSDLDKLLSALRAGRLDSQGVLDCRVFNEGAKDLVDRELRLAVLEKARPPKHVALPRPQIAFAVRCYRDRIEGLEASVYERAKSLLPSETHKPEEIVVYLRRCHVTKDGARHVGIYAQSNFVPFGHATPTKVFTNVESNLLAILGNMLLVADGKSGWEDARNLTVAGMVFASSFHKDDAKYLLHESLFDAAGACLVAVGA